MAKKQTKKKPKKKVKKSPRKKPFRIKEVTASLSGVIRTADFENLRPSFGITVQPTQRQTNPNKIFDQLEATLQERLALINNQAKTEVLDNQYEHITFREKGHKRYPRVTSILLDWNWIREIGPDKLSQYAARGKIIHKLLEIYFKTRQWADPMDIPELKEQVSILLTGSLGLHWEQCSHRRFIEQYGSKIKITKQKSLIFNEHHLYSGEIDALGKFEGKRAIIDFKTGGYDLRQLAAYAVCKRRIEALVVFPVGPTDNICGYKRPVICDTIQDQFQQFLAARAKFKRRFGI